MKRLFFLAPLLVPMMMHASTITGTYDIDTVDGSATTGTGPYELTSTASTYSLLTFTPTAGQDFTFSDITDLDLAYDVVTGGIEGGAPRIEVDFTNGDSLLALLGPAGSFLDPTLGPGDSGNLITQDDTGRYDLSQGGLGGSGYTNYDAALAAAGSLQVSGFDIILDGGGFSLGDQQFNLSASPLTVQANLAPVPEPGYVALSALGLIALVGLARLRSGAPKESRKP